MIERAQEKGNIDARDTLVMAHVKMSVFCGAGMCIGAMIVSRRLDGNMPRRPEAHHHASRDVSQQRQPQQCHNQHASALSISVQRHESP